MKTERKPDAEQAFRRRYNRTVIVEQGKEVDNGKCNKTETKITSKYKTEYLITEHLKDDLTDYVEVASGGKTYTYRTYLEAEVHVADKIGEEK